MTPAAPASLEQRMAARFEALRASPPELLALVRLMPKGGDLHSHLAGAIYAESYLAWAVDAGLCVVQSTFVLEPPPCEATGRRPAQSALFDPTFYRQLVDAWSMRNWSLSGQSGHDHFFDIFAKFGLAGLGKMGEMLAENVTRAAAGHVSYIEVMVTPDGGGAAAFGQRVGWNGDVAATRAALLAQGLDTVVTQTMETVRRAEARKDELLKCGTADQAPGCRVTLRYVFQINRAGSLGAAFAQMVAGFALADRPDSRIVALNLVAPEDDAAAMRNFHTHMQMLQALRSLYPRAHLTLHAGELAPGLVPSDGLQFHIRESVEIAGATRIGHGVDVMHETGAVELLRRMAEQQILVEICLTSNDGILGVRGANHPLATYIKYGVPVALATDDEGVSRSEMSLEYLRAAEDQRLGYVQLKSMARMSLEHAFIGGESLWRDGRRFVIGPACASDTPSAATPSSSCARLLETSEKARLQWALEADLHSFEQRVDDFK
jgi:hypothetical protein